MSGPIFEVQGQRPSGHWVGLYQYRDPLMAKAVVMTILDMEEYELATHKDGLGEFEDFRVAIVDMPVSVSRRLLQDTSTSSSKPPEKPAKARGRRSRPQSHQQRSKDR